MSTLGEYLRDEGVDAPDAPTVRSPRVEVERLEREHRRVCEENDGLRQLCLSMFEEHQRIYDTSLCARMRASNKQMAHWYVECRKHGIEVCR